LEDRYIRFAGIVQRISEQTNIGRDKVVRIGARQFQDQSSHKDKKINASRVVRAGDFNPKGVKQFEQPCNEVVNFLGHTQNIPMYVNVLHGVGGAVDRFKSKNLKKNMEHKL
jgi:hypothetical protein